MEPLLFSKTLAPLGQPGRVERTKSRGDSGKGSSFSNQLRRKKNASSGAPSSSQEDSEFSFSELPAEEIETPGGRRTLSKGAGDSLAGRKVIDVLA